MRLRAMAKINLGLDVLGERPDGYHEVRMVMQTISVYDVLELKKRKESGIALETNLPYIPTDRRNLVYRAAELLMQEKGVTDGLSVSLKKVIPVAAGLAGGSADAAAAMVGVNRLFGLGFSREELMERAVRIGADVPYCIMQGTALAEGIGEKLKRLPPMPDCYVLIGKPKVSVSTKMAYETLDFEHVKERPDIDRMIEALERKDIRRMAGYMENVFEPGITGKYPVIREIRTVMEQCGAVRAMMSGSGPTVFGLFDDRKRMNKAASRLRRSSLCRTIRMAGIYNPGEQTYVESTDK